MKKLPKKRNTGWKLRIVPVLALLAGSFVLWNHKDKVLEKLGLQVIGSESTKSTVQVGSKIDISGDLSSSSNLRLYTMTLTTKDQKIFGIKSTTLGLSSYRNKYVTVKGTIVSIINGMPIINVTSIVGDDQSNTTSTQTTTYISEAGIIINPNKLTNYTFKEKKNNTLIFSPKGTGNNLKNITVSFFDCTDDTSSTGCKHLISTGKDTFSGTDGDKWSMVSAKRIGSNDNRIGYSVEGVTKDQLQDIVRSFNFMNDNTVTKKYLNDAKRSCTDASYTLSTIKTTTISYQQTVDFSFDGTDTSGTSVHCITSIDPISGEATLKTITKKDEQKQETKDDEKDETSKTDETENDNDAATEDTNNDPAPSLTTPYTFESSKGYSITYPSSSIAFEGVSDPVKLGIQGVSGCYRQMNVAHYTNKDAVTTKPAIIMYNCANVSSTIGSTDGLIRKDSTDSKQHFFIKVINPAWKEFAEKIVVK